MRSPFAPIKSRKELYKEQYNATKEGGEVFFPETIARDAIVAIVLVALIFTIAILFPVTSEPPADPTSTTYNPRPEWYFLFFFQFLKLFPGSMEAVAAVIIPTIAILVLVLLPFLDRGMTRNWSRRKHVVGMGVAVVVFVAALGILGATSAPARPAGEESLLVQSGREVYREINCAYCHSVGGIGGNIGPDLSGVGGKLSEEELSSYLQNPHAMVPETLHPKLLFTDEELKALSAYLLTLGAPVTYSDEAPILFERECSSCHIVNGKGGALGPDLSTVGSRRNVNFLESFTADPKTVLPGASMPAFKDKLTPEQIKDIAAYLYSLKGEAETSTQATGKGTQPPAATALPPAVPHTLEGRSSCLACHETGIGGAPGVPADHSGRTNDICLACHKAQ